MSAWRKGLRLFPLNLVWLFVCFFFVTNLVYFLPYRYIYIFIVKIISICN